MKSFAHIFRRDGIRAQIVEGDSFHRFGRLEMRERMKEAEAAGHAISHFGPEANLLAELESLFAGYGRNGGGQVRRYIHDAQEAAGLRKDALHGVPPSTRRLPRAPSPHDLNLAGA